MITVFNILLAIIFARLAIFAFKLTWGITKVIFYLILAPLALIALVAAGFIGLAFPILIVVGILSIIFVR